MTDSPTALRAASLAALALLAATASAQTTSALETAFPALSFANPVELTHAGDGSGRLYVGEKAGRIRSFDNVRTATTATTVLDVTGLVRNLNDLGFLGFAFHPDFAANGHVYVHYSGRPDGRTVLARYTRSAANPAVFDPASAQVLLEVAQRYVDHKGGKLAFGPDGYLYLSLGDGGGESGVGGDPQNNAQNRAVLLGKMLRLDVDRPAPGLNYGIPPTNPYAGNTDGFREEIFAYGLRNVWKFSFDRATGALWAADVGQGLWEEIDLIESGGNYGWRVMEGAHCFNPSTGCVQTGLTLPVFEYANAGANGCSVTGGTVYRGTRNPDLTGRYVYSDYCSGTVSALSVGGGTPTNQAVLQAGFGVVGFGEDAEGELYVLKLATGASSIRRFVVTTVADEGGPEGAAVSLGAPQPNPATARAAFDVAASGPVRVSVVDVLGREVALVFEGALATGEPRRLSVDTSGFAAGVYAVRLDAGRAGVRVRRLVVVR